MNPGGQRGGDPTLDCPTVSTTRPAAGWRSGSGFSGRRLFVEGSVTPRSPAGAWYPNTRTTDFRHGAAATTSGCTDRAQAGRGSALLAGPRGPVVAGSRRSGGGSRAAHTGRHGPDNGARQPGPDITVPTTRTRRRGPDNETRQRETGNAKQATRTGQQGSGNRDRASVRSATGPGRSAAVGQAGGRARSGVDISGRDDPVGRALGSRAPASPPAHAHGPLRRRIIDQVTDALGPPTAPAPRTGR
jgi:hypothetical protein